MSAILQKTSEILFPKSSMHIYLIFGAQVMTGMALCCRWIWTFQTVLRSQIYDLYTGELSFQSYESCLLHPFTCSDIAIATWCTAAFVSVIPTLIDPILVMAVHVIRDRALADSQLARSLSRGNSTTISGTSSIVLRLNVLSQHEVELALRPWSLLDMRFFPFDCQSFRRPYTLRFYSGIRQCTSVTLNGIFIMSSLAKRLWQAPVYPPPYLLLTREWQSWVRLQHTDVNALSLGGLSTSLTYSYFWKKAALNLGGAPCILPCLPSNYGSGSSFKSRHSHFCTQMRLESAIVWRDL